MREPNRHSQRCALDFKGGTFDLQLIDTALIHFPLATQIYFDESSRVFLSRGLRARYQPFTFAKYSALKG